MARGVNKVILIGRLGQDPEVRYMPNGHAVANATLATSESWKDQQGQLQERTEWHRLVFYKRLAEIVGEYLKKGSNIYIEGQLRTREWQDQQGQKRWTTEIHVRELQMLDNKPQTGQPQGGYTPPPQRPAQQRPVAQQPMQQGMTAQNQAQQSQQGYQYNPTGYQEPPLEFEDDIPF